MINQRFFHKTPVYIHGIVKNPFDLEKKTLLKQLLKLKKELAEDFLQFEELTTAENSCLMILIQKETVRVKKQIIALEKSESAIKSNLPILVENPLIKQAYYLDYKEGLFDGIKKQYNTLFEQNLLVNYDLHEDENDIFENINEQEFFGLNDENENENENENEIPESIIDESLSIYVSQKKVQFPLNLTFQDLIKKKMKKK